MKTKQDAEKLFLRAFVTTLIENSPKEKIIEIPEPEEIIYIPQRIKVKGMPKQEAQKKIKEPQLPKLPERKLPQLPQLPGPPLDKLSRILRDPSIQGIECPGPGKNILVNKSNIIQTTPIIFTKEEIAEVLNHFSERTKIPLIQGVFKAALGNIIITAVISKFVGSRFILQKSFYRHI